MEQKNNADADTGFWTIDLAFMLLRYAAWWLIAWFLACNYLRLQVISLEKSGGPSADVFVLPATVCLLDELGASWLADRLVALASPGAPQAPPEAAKAGAKRPERCAKVPEAATIDPAQAVVDPSGQSLAVALANLQRTLEHRLHRPQTLADALLKILVVVVLSWLWFRTFQVASGVKASFSRWLAYKPSYDAGPARSGSGGLVERARAPAERPDSAWGVNFLGGLIKRGFAFVALLPAIPFILAMYNAYEPAVFVMALVAIYVAAEHYGGLVYTEHELKTRTDELKSTMGTVLDADGLNAWRTEVYDLYGKATRRIDAVIRTFDIDVDWWKCAKSKDPWHEYSDRCKAGSGEYTLLHVMAKSEAKVQFVVDLPLPPSEMKCSTPEKGKFFEDLLGLAWYVVVFDLAFAQRKELREKQEPRGRTPASLHVKVARAPSWMHVIDDETVYQLIERPTAGTSTVRQLTYSMTDPAAKRALTGWARESVRRFADRGGRAEEYVFSVLRYGALQLGRGDSSPLEDILNKLGMGEYLSEPKADFRILEPGVGGARARGPMLISADEAQSLCLAVFKKLIELSTERGLIQDWATHPLDLHQLFRELL